MSMRFDRRAPEELMNALRPNGFAHSMVEYGRSGAYWLDLQLRGYENKPEKRATLYVGLTKVLDLILHPTKGFRLDAHETHASGNNGWDEDWRTWHGKDWWAAQWQHVEAYLENVIPTVGASHLKEGAVQAAISAFRSTDRVVIDREAIMAFDSTPERSHTHKTLASDLLAALERPNAPAWWSARPHKLGGECDALAINNRGELLTIEIKPADTSSLPWALVQVMHYATLFRAWSQQSGNAHAVLQGMLDQRRDLGLTFCGESWTVANPVVVRPVLAFDRRANDTARARLQEVADHLRSRGMCVDVDLYQVNRVGRMDRVDLFD